MELEKYITNIKFWRGMLEVSGFIPKRQWARDLKITIKTKHIKNLLSKEYQIFETIKEDTISNSANLGYSEYGLWAFKAKKIQVKNKKPTKVVEKEAAPPEVPSEKVVTPEEPAQTKEESPRTPRKKTSTKRSIRGRMSKIAKNSKTKESN